MIYSIFKKKAQEDPNKKIVIEGEVYTYNYLLQNVEKKKISFKPFTHIGVFLENSIEFVELLLLASKYKLTLIPFASKNIDFEKFDIEVIYDGNFKKIKDYSPKKSGYIIVSTSGSTSTPKPIVLTEEIKLKRIEIAKNTYQLSHNDTILISTPMHHSLALRGVLIGLTLGMDIIILKNFSPTKFLHTLEKEKVTFTFAVSNQLESIKDIIKNYDISSLKTLISTSYALKPDTKKELLQFTNIYECYGTSEIGCVTHLSPEDINFHSNSVGKVLNGVEIKIKNGEILVKSPWRFKEYYKMKEETKNAFDGNLFKTGDLGEIIDGYLYYKGRKKELIKSGGISIYPVDIEKVLYEVEGVEEVAVIGIEDEYFGEVVVAVVVVGDVKKSDLVKASYNLAPYQRPMYYDIVSTLPKNGLGKIQKFKLKEKYKHLNLGKKLKGLK